MQLKATQSAVYLSLHWRKRLILTDATCFLDSVKSLRIFSVNVFNASFSDLISSMTLLEELLARRGPGLGRGLAPEVEGDAGRVSEPVEVDTG